MEGKYKVITLCGSTRFKDAFMDAQKRLTLKGNIVISVGLFGHSGDDEVWSLGTKEMLDDMHRSKIDLADEVFVIDVGHYIGDSTKAEIEYALQQGKQVDYYSSYDWGNETNKKKHLEDAPSETFFKDWFHDCKTLLFTDRSGNQRKFVEYINETETIDLISDVDCYEDLFVKNAVHKLIKEKQTQFFYDKSEKGVFPVIINNQTLFVRYEDVTRQWPDHYWLRARRPIIGFKAVSKTGGSVMTKPTDPDIRYELGEEYIVPENEMLNNNRFGPFFSPSIYKANNYLEQGYKMYLVAASGLIFVKNHWDDMAASSLRIMKRLTSKDIKAIMMQKDNPTAFWSGDRWDSFDEAMSDTLWGY